MSSGSADSNSTNMVSLGSVGHVGSNSTVVTRGNSSINLALEESMDKCESETEESNTAVGDEVETGRGLSAFWANQPWLKLDIKVEKLRRRVKKLERKVQKLEKKIGLKEASRQNLG